MAHGGDILQGDFVDDPENSTLKHLLGFEWVLGQRCFSPSLIVKANDNVFVEIFHLFEFVQAVYGSRLKHKSFICDVIQGVPLKGSKERHVAHVSCLFTFWKK